MRTNSAAISIPGLADYRLVAQGGFGRVYEARQPAFDRRVAIKVLEIADETARRRFATECRALGSLSQHPSIVPLYDAGFLDDGRAYLLMPFLEGGSLADRLKHRGPRPLWEAVHAVVEIAGALETAHRAGILHRDVKPENILVAQSSRSQLADFGISRVSGMPATTTGMATATLAHAAPELIDGGKPTASTDLYALASTLFTLVAGRSPFAQRPDESFASVLRRIALDPVPELPGVDGRVQEIMLAGLAKTPEDRPASVAELGTCLREASTDGGNQPPDLLVIDTLAERARSAATAQLVPDGDTLPDHGLLGADRPPPPAPPATAPTSVLPPQHPGAPSSTQRPSVKTLSAVAIAAILLVVAFLALRAAEPNQPPAPSSVGSTTAPSVTSPPAQDTLEAPRAAAPVDPAETGEPAGAEPAEAAPGQSSDEGFEFSINGFHCGETTVGAGQLSVTSQGEFCILSLVVRNIGNEPAAFSPHLQRLIGEGGTIYASNSTASVYRNQSRSHVFLPINPGLRVEADVVFDVPPEAVIRAAELHGTLFSEGVVIQVAH